jgi:hypothetical protein
MDLKKPEDAVVGDLAGEAEVRVIQNNGQSRYQS